MNRTGADHTWKQALSLFLLLLGLILVSTALLGDVWLVWV
jgi:hypothetical protein